MAALLGLALAANAVDCMAQDSDAARLRAYYEASTQRLQESPLGQPLVLESSEGGDLIGGEIYARVDHSIGELTQALDDPQEWCELLMLHPNTAQCQLSGEPQAPVLEIGITREIGAKDMNQLAFSLRSAPAAADYFSADLSAPKGPMSTSDYQIRVEAVALDPDSIFLHLRYSYRAAWTTRMAVKAWLATLASDCVGFTVTGVTRHGKAEYIRGMRGSAERNVMRYFLAFEAVLRARSDPAQQRFERSMVYWLEGIGHYPRQLVDEDIPPYLEVKRRQHPPQPASDLAAR